MRRRNVFGIVLFLLFVTYTYLQKSDLGSKQVSLVASPSPSPVVIVDAGIVTPPSSPEVMGITDEIPFFEVVSVTDGDTIKVRVGSKIETVRIVGINTPETVDPRKPVECFGREATGRMKSLVDGKKVMLQSDEQQQDRDRYGRLLRFVFLEDGTDVGLAMIQGGFAYQSLYSDQPHMYYEEYVSAEKTARESKVGLWADGACEN